MKKTPFALALIVVLAVIAINSALAQQTISSYNTTIQIMDDGVLISKKLVFENSENLSFSFSLPEDASILDFYVDRKRAEPKIIDAETRKILNINARAKEIELKYTSKEIIIRNSKSYFTYNMDIPLQAENLAIQLMLPKRAMLYTPDSAYPAPDKMATDGQKITLIWERRHQNQDFPIFVIYSEEYKANLLVYSAILVTTLIVVVTIYIFLKKKARKAKPRQKKKARKKKRKAAKKETIEKLEEHMLPAEKAVIDCLKEAKGEMWQKQIQIKTGFSKAKLSRTIRNLEARNLIKRIPLGNTNRIKLR